MEVNLLFLLCFTLYLRVLFQVQVPGGLIFGGRFNRGFFGLPIWGFIFRGAYTWRGLFIFTVCVSWVGEHISLGICVCQVGVTRDKCFHCREHISLGICVSQVGEHISLGICVSHVGERISLGISVSQVGNAYQLGIRVPV